MRRVLFVCTGNIFRSLTADRAVRSLLAEQGGFHVSSAGTVDYPHEVRPYTLCGVGTEWLPDIEDVIPDYQTNRPAVEAHVRATIDRIVDLAPRMAENMDSLMQRYGRPRT